MTRVKVVVGVKVRSMGQVLILRMGRRGGLRMGVSLRVRWMRVQVWILGSVSKGEAGEFAQGCMTPQGCGCGIV